MLCVLRALMRTQNTQHGLKDTLRLRHNVYERIVPPRAYYQANREMVMLQTYLILRQESRTQCGDAQNASFHEVSLQTFLYAILMGVEGSGIDSPTSRSKRCQAHHGTRSSGPKC